MSCESLLLLLLFLSPGPSWGFQQGPAVSCSDAKKKILCLPREYSKFDLPYRDDHNIIDIGSYIIITVKSR